MMRALAVLAVPAFAGFAAFAAADEPPQYETVYCAAYRNQYRRAPDRFEDWAKYEIGVLKCSWPGAKELAASYHGPPPQFFKDPGIALALTTVPVAVSTARPPARRPTSKPSATPRPDVTPRTAPTPGTAGSDAPESAPPPASEVAADAAGSQVPVERPTVIGCGGEALGWLGLLEDRVSGPRPTVAFDGGPPEQRTGAANAVPMRNEALTFGNGNPASLFVPPVPCALSNTNRCDQIKVSGHFRVVASLPYPAGPRGQIRWQLCLVRNGDPR